MANETAIRHDSHEPTDALVDSETASTANSAESVRRTEARSPCASRRQLRTAIHPFLHGFYESMKPPYSARDSAAVLAHSAAPRTRYRSNSIMIRGVLSRARNRQYA